MRARETAFLNALIAGITHIMSPSPGRARTTSTDLTSFPRSIIPNLVRLPLKSTVSRIVLESVRVTLGYIVPAQSDWNPEG